MIQLPSEKFIISFLPKSVRENISKKAFWPPEKKILRDQIYIAVSASECMF